MTTWIFTLISIMNIAARPAEPASIDTMHVAMKIDSVQKSLMIWQSKMAAENIFNDSLSRNNSTGRLLTARLPYIWTDSRFVLDSMGADTTRIIASFPSYLRNEHQHLLEPKLYGTVYQSLNLKFDNGKNLEKKSLGAYLGLSVLNTGVSGMYLKNDNIVYTVNTPLIVVNGIFDAGSVAMMFFDKYRTTGVTFFVIYRLVSLLGIPSLNLHNRFAETGYQYEF